ncbi:Phosphopantetheine adenylyltransferase [Labeo rohita]|uniref:Phosphopantetheine adenylyltransferase n=1 Tax=Labeo rohita TaxID=84645 RepID=A0ABQ8L703_LABRO|nr:Phosphopantetheine adenylyltransferase [Labeo rohita]
MAFSVNGDEFDDTMTGLGLGRGKISGQTPVAPNVRESRVNRTPHVLCSTRVIDNVPSPTADTLPLAVPDINDPNWQGLIAHIAQQVGQTTLASQRETSYGEGENRGAQTQGLSPTKTFTDIPSPNLIGVRLVMQSDAKEPPLYRGDSTDKLGVCEWEELMDTYLRKRGIPLAEQHQEILSRLMAGEGPVEYWVQLNKAVDLAEEALKRLGRRMEDPCQEVAMMFVKYCPDPT